MDQDDIRFSPEHVWVRLEEDLQVVIGVTEEALPDGEEITKLRLPAEGDELVKDETFGRLTTSKPSVIRLYAPVAGEVLETNEDLLDAPDLISEDPYEEGWLIRVELTHMGDYDNLMTRDEYDDFLSEEFEEEDEEETDLVDALDEDEDDEEDDY